ncbi:MAG TPA: amidohydrolase family protein [Burkholderiaceae bacterium]|jgi:L-fuconolactonase
MSLRLDSHQHFWRMDRGDYAWLRDAPSVLQRDFLPADLQETLPKHEVAQTVLVQAADTVEETDYLLGLAAEHAFIGGVVGWVDLSRRDSIATLERWSRQPKFKGVRPMLQDLPDVDWIATQAHPEALDALVHFGLRLDALVMPQHLESLLQVLREHPDLPVVIDHAAKPPLTRGWHADWVPSWCRHMGELAALPQVCCKFSGLMAPLDEVRPVWELLLQWFGPSRLMWGSDWPVLTLNSDYAGWVRLSAALIDSLPADEAAQVWRGTAQRFYGLSS